MLQSKLQEITSCGSLKRQIVLIDNLKLTDKHGIILLESFLTIKKAEKYNCFAYALGLKDSLEIKKWYEYVGFPSKFILNLIEKSILLPKEDGGIILYFNRGKLTHGGIVVGNRVRSKWGNGHLFEHDILEIPSNYGTDYKFFDKPDIVQVIKEFKDYFHINE